MFHFSIFLNVLHFFLFGGDEEVDGGDDEEGEEGADGHAGGDGDTDVVSGGSAGAGNKDERHVPHDGGSGGHEDGAESCGGSFEDGIVFIHALFHELIGEFDDEDAVFRDEADEGDETDLGVDVDGCVFDAEKNEEHRCGKRERRGA